MKINRLYIRNFIMVMAIIIAAQICIAGLFRIVGSVSGKKHYQSELNVIAYLIGNAIAEKTGNAELENISKILKEISKAWSADIWLEDSSGKIIASSLNIPKPEFPSDMENLGHSGIYRDKGGPPSRFLKMELEGKRTVYIRQYHKNIFLDDIYFMAGLIIITLVVALILFPVSKRITDPLNRFTESANAISRGEFDLRVAETSYYEIAELARAFNRMSDRVLQMINGTKELTANISHQIRSPLARISVSTELIRKNILSGDITGIEEKLSLIENDIEHMNTLTGRIIELIRVDIAHRNNEYENIDLKKTARETEIKFIDMIRKKGIISTIDEILEPISLPGMHRDIYELFEILYDNAVRYSPEDGFIKLEFSSEKKDISFGLSNSCFPFTDAAILNIFEPFTRNAPEKIQGHGLGLAIAGRIVKNHGGEISARYCKNVFTVTIKFPSSAPVFGSTP